MKLAKKLMVAAAALAAFGLVGCGMNNDEYGIIDFDSVRDMAYTDKTNDTDNTYIRGYRTFKTGHVAANCAMSFKEPADGKTNGNMGYIFNMTTNEDKSINFILLTVGYKNKDNEKFSADGLYYYLSYYKNIGEDYINGSASNFCDIDGNVIGSKDSKATEKSVIGSSKNWALTNISKVEKDYLVYIGLTYDENTSKYTLNFGNAEYDDQKNLIPGTNKVYTNKEIDATNFGVTDNKKPDNKMGAYAMVAKGKTLQGSWYFQDLQGNPLPVEVIE